MAEPCVQARSAPDVHHHRMVLVICLQQYPHVPAQVPGDGRELAVTVADAFKVRAEDGRGVEAVDVSPFIAGLPLGRDTRCFRRTTPRVARRKPPRSR